MAVDGKLSRANCKSIDDECPSDISRSNRFTALFIQKINVKTNKKKTKIVDSCFRIYKSSFFKDKIPSINSSHGSILLNQI